MAKSKTMVELKKHVSRFLRDAEEVVYKVTEPMGSEKIGAKIPAVLLTVDDDSGIGLLFHPKRHYLEASSVEFGKCGRDGVWRAAGKHYVNLL